MSRNDEPESRQSPGLEYDATPYTSLPYANTQPAHLGALLPLHGLEAPAIEGARVLELGCASGGNIIPLAARFPMARFVGVDLAQQHIDAGRERIARLSLTNIDLRQGDLSEIAFEGPEFDYVVCHGVYSWVPAAVQKAILRICQSKLSPQGAAVISYNVLPGWRLRQAIRDICLRHAGQDQPARLRIARVREILNDIAAASNVAEPYGLLMRSEARRIAHRPGSYILGEFLATHNSPCFFADFLAEAEAHGLAYVCETDPGSPGRAAMRARASGARMEEAHASLLEQETYADYFTGRTFRSSLLCRAGASKKEPSRPGALQNLHLSAHLTRIGDADTTGQFRDPRGRTIAPTDEHVSRVLSHLAAVYPNTLPWNEVSALLPPEARSRMESPVVRLVQEGIVRLSASPLKVGRADDQCPVLWRHARLEIEEGQPWITGLHHSPVALKPMLKTLAPLLDGSHDRASLSARARAAIASGEVILPELKEAAGPVDAARLQELADRYLDLTLRYLASNALLAPLVD